MISSGRWMPGNILSKYTSPIIMFVVVLILLGVISVMINKMFKIKNRIYMTIVSLLITTFPILALSFGYTFMIERYIVSLFLAVLAVFIVDKYKCGFILGMVLLCISLGYYQAYITVTITLTMIMIIKKIVQNNDKIKDNLRYILKYLIMGLGGVILYLICTKIICHVSGVDLSSYKGVNNLGTLPPLNMFKFLFMRTYGHVVLFIFGRAFLAPFKYALIPQILLAFLNIVLLIDIFVKRKLNKANVVLLIILLLLFPLGLNIFDFLLYESSISSLNLYQLVFVFILPFILLSLKKESEYRRIYKICSIIGLICSVILIWNNFSITNLYYTKMRDYNKSTEMLVNRILSRVEIQDNVSSERKVLFGNKKA